jgi:hypothetical protein
MLCPMVLFMKRVAGADFGSGAGGTAAKKSMDLAKPEKSRPASSPDAFTGTFVRPTS